MKRIYAIVVVFIVFTFFVAISPVHAANPTPIPPTIGSVPVGIKIPNGVNNVIIQSQHGPDYEPTPGDPYINTVPSENVSTTDFKIPKPLDPISTWLMSVLPFMNAKSITDKVIPHQNNLYISGQARRCIYLPGATKPIEDVGDTYKTELVEYLPKLMTATELLSANTVRNVVSLKNGSYDFRGPSYEVDKAPPCGSTGEGTQQNPKPVTLTQTFSFAEWWKQFRDKIQVKRELVSKQQTPEADRIHCLLNGCVQSGADLGYIGDSNKQEVVNKSGGIADSFRTVTMNTTKGESPHGQEENFTKTNTSYTKQMENSANLIKCSLVPKGKRSSIGLSDEDCADFVRAVPETSCEKILATLPSTSYAGFNSDGGALGFTIPMHNMSCTISNVQAVASFAKAWANKQEGYDNVMMWYPTIEKYAKQYGWNPAFIVALWIEESAADSVGAQQLGCVYNFGTKKPVPKESSICEQLSCVFQYKKTTSTHEFLCSYGAAKGCNTFYIDAKNDNRCFPSNIRGSYQKVVSLGGVNAACAPTGRTSEHFRRDCEAKVPDGSIFDK